MLSIKRLSKKFGRQSLSEVKPAPLSSTVDHTTPPTVTKLPPSPHAHHQSPLCTKQQSLPWGSHPPPCDQTSDSSDSESEESPSSPTRGSPVHKIIHKKHLSSKLKIERVSSAEKRSYRQYKYSTGSSSSASSSDDEIKEAFEGYTHLHYTPCSPINTSLREPKQGSPHSYNSVEPVYTSRPLKVVPVGHRKPKYFAQMSGAFSERPRLDFNKMQHSKRLVVVRRPLVLRNNSKVHSYQQRPPSLEVSLDISAHTFQPVLTQTS